MIHYGTFSCEEESQKHFRRALQRLKIEGDFKMTAPVEPSEHVEIPVEVQDWLKELAQPLQDFYASLGRHLSTTDLAAEIELRFGNQIVQKMCIPHGLSQGACLIIAIEVARKGFDN